MQRITLLYDGIRIRNYTSRVHPLTLSGRLLWQHAKHISFGSHTLTVQAFDEMGNVSQTQILFKHVNTKPHKRCSRRRRRC